jgi:hypothetical protein
MPRVEIHDKATQALIEILERAYGISYDLQTNAASAGSFMLPRDDPKWSVIAAYQETWIYNDADELIDIFRIASVQERREDRGTLGMVKLEGFACALQDDFIADEQIYTNQTVTAILTALLAFQAVARVTLGTVDAALDKVISTRASNVNVMRACWEVRNVVGGFISVDPVAGTPATRKLNLRVDPGQDIGQRIHKGLNLRGLSKATESQSVITKIFPLGRGEGRNQQRPSSDKLMAQPATFTLVGASRSLLVLTDLYSRYKGWTAAGAALPTGVDANDTRSRPLKVWRAAVDETANFEQGADERTLRSKVNDYNPGAGAWTLDYVHADYLIADDTVGTYGTIGNAFTDKTLENSEALVRSARTYIAGVKSPRVSHEVQVIDLARIYPTESFERLHLHDKVNIYDPDLSVTTKDRVVAVRYGDMLDPSTYQIVVTNVELAELNSRAAQVADRIRKYEQQADGATTLLGPDSFEDNVDATHPYTRNIEIPSDAISVLSVKLRMRTKAYRYYVSAANSADGGGATPTSSTDTFTLGGASPSDSGSSGTASTGSDSTGSSAHTTDAQGVHDHTGSTAHSTANHDHGNAANTLVTTTIGFGHDNVGSGGSHSHNVNSHSHGHSHTGPAHTHTIGHGHSVPGHAHTVTISVHTHVITLTPGIIETTTPTSMEVKVDGVVASAAAVSLDDFDLTPYLTKNTDGTIVRGLHTVTFTPNGVGRVQATIKGVVFLQSRGQIVG